MLNEVGGGITCTPYLLPSFTDMRRDVQEIFKMTPHDKQVMMFSATLAKEIRPVCKKFMNNVILSGCCGFGDYAGSGVYGVLCG